MSQSRHRIQRVRHEFAARHGQLVHRHHLSPGFIRLTFSGPELAGFTSLSFCDHVKLILPQAGQEKPTLPRMVDGRPNIDGKRPIMRDYTPLNYDSAQQTLQLDFALHGAGAAVDWAKTAPLGQWVGLAGPRASMVLPAGLDWYLLLGDETALPAIERFLQERPVQGPIYIRVQVDEPAEQRVQPADSLIDMAYVSCLEQALQNFVLPAGEGFCWAAAEYQQIDALRQEWQRKGMPLTHGYLTAYWRHGVAG